MKDTTHKFLSPVLKKIANIFSADEPNGYFFARVVDSSKETNMSNISTVPKLREAAFSRSTYCYPEEIKLIITQAAKRADERDKVLREKRMTLSKANKYNIPYDKEEPDFLGLMDEISDYEGLLSRADELDIDWDYSNYDVKSLSEQISAAINDPYRVRRNDDQQHRWDYYASIRLV